MRDNNMKYGFNMNILDDARSFPSLWSRTRSFINAHPELIHPDADLDWLLDSHNSGDYNNCQFFSNFEIGDLNFFRGEANEKYFDWLDRGGGFYYERFGDAPIHTLSVAMFVPKSEIWFFRDIGYQHDINRPVIPPFPIPLSPTDPVLFTDTVLHNLPTAALATLHRWTKTFTGLYRSSLRKRNQMTLVYGSFLVVIGLIRKRDGHRLLRGRLVVMDIMGMWLEGWMRYSVIWSRKMCVVEKLRYHAAARGTSIVESVRWALHMIWHLARKDVLISSHISSC